jgi:hypothetical protein
VNVTNFGHPVIVTKYWKAKHLKVFGSNKPKGLNRMAKVGYVHICLLAEIPKFDNNYIISLIQT